MANLSRRTKIVIAFVAVVAAGYLLVLYFQSANAVPVAFDNARAQSAIIAQNIVTTSNQSSATLQQVNADDLKGDYSDALNLVATLLTQSQDLRNQAIQLSNQIQNMTQALSGVNDTQAQQAAFEAISSHLALINQLINYSGDLANLSDALNARFEGKPVGTGVPGSIANGATISALVDQVNTDIAAINNFNNQATQAMQQFDKLTGK